MDKYIRELIFMFVILILFILINNIDTFLNLKNLNIDNILNNYNNEILLDYNELLKTNNLNINNKLELILSKVKYRDIYNFNKELIIYKGFIDGISKNDAVLTNDGLIGIIDTVYKNTSKVRLISNIDSNISVKINNSYGILKNINNNFIVKDINNYEKVQKGDLVYTSGLGNIPKNIIIGKVSSINLNSTKIEQEILIDLYADLNNINFLYIYRGRND